MQAFGKRMRGGLAALISAALITSGALLAAPAAYAEEAAPTTEPAIAAETTAEAPADTPAEEAPVEETPAEEAPLEEVPAEDAPAEDAPAQDGEDSEAAEDEAAADEDAPTAKNAPQISPQGVSAFAEAAPTVVPAEAPRAGGEITVTGSGFAAGYPGIYLAIGPAGLPGFYAGASSLIDTIHISTLNAGEDNTPGARKAKMNADGSFSVTFTVPVFEEDKPYSLYASKAHGQGATDTSQNVITAIEYAAPKVWAPAFSVELADGTPLAAGDKVYKGDKLVVKGTGFDPEANVGGRGMPIPATLPQGSYVTFTQAEPEWRPSENGVRIRNQASEKWLLAESVLNQVDPRYQGAIRNQWAPLAADGSWELELELTTPSNPTPDGVYGVYSYAAGGAVNAAQELRFELDYTDSARPKVWAPAFSVELADGTPLAAGDKVYKGDKLVVKGTGFDPEANVGGRGMPIPATLPQGSYVTFTQAEPEWRPSENGVRIRNQASEKWLLAESVLNQVDPRYQGAIRNQWAPLAADGSWELELELTTPSNPTPDGVYGVYSYAAGGAVNAAQELRFELDYTDSARPKVWAPAFSVELADGTPLAAGDKVYKGDKLVVKGTGFDPEANVGGRGMPIPATLPQGSYVTFTQAEPEWRPSENGVRIRNQASEKWLLAESVLNQVDPRYQGAIRNQWAPLADDGSWELELELTTPSNPTPDGVYGVYSYAAGGAVNAAQELRFELDYTDSARPVTEPTFEPELEVFLADGTTPYTNQELKEGDKLVVKGSGYDPFANFGGVGQPIPADKPQGTFVVFGKFADNWKPSDGVTSSKRTMNPANRGWLLAESTLENDVPELHRSEIRKQWVELDEATGSFSWTVTLAEPETPLADGNWGIYTYAGGVNTKNAEHELSIPLNFKAKTTTEPETPTATGSLQWGIYSQFRGYVESNSDGRVELLGAATRSGNVFGFTQAKGGNWNAQAETGELKFSGGVAFFAHGDALSLTIEDPILQVTASGAVLTARFDHGPQTPFADVDLSAATRTVAEDGSVTWAGAKTTMRAEGVEKFLGFYPAGTVLDPLTFTVGASADPTDPEPTTPKATVQSVKVAGDKLQVAGKAENVKGEVSVGLIERGTAAKAGGKTVILAQSDVKSANGAASFSLSAAKDKLDRTKLYEVVVWPKGKAPNTGSILASANVNVTSALWLALFGAPKPTDPENPDLAGGVLKWGVIEPFRNYVEGPIAHGEIRMLGQAVRANGVFEFPQAVGGSWNAEKQRGEVRYAGGVFFSGHDGALALSITDPQIKVIDASRAVLNAKVDGKLIPVANLDLSAAKRSEKDGAVTWAGATAALRTEAVGTFLDRYKAGTAMDPVTFTVGAAAVVPGDEGPSVIVHPVSVAGGALEVLGQAENLKSDASVALIERGGAGTVEPVVQIDPAVENGVAEFALTAKKEALDRTKSYEVVVWAKGTELDADAILAAADVNIGKADWDKLFGTTTPVAPPAEKSPAAGSLNWGVSTAFADYVTGSIAKGEIRTAGVGGGRGGYLFPQATGSSWNKDTRTGTVRYSGTVTFWGHGGLLDVTFANPVITVSNPLSGSITAGGQTFPLNLGAAGFTAHADGSVTWSNVPVSGAISGGDGQGAGGSLALDSLTFTVGSTSAANFGSTVTSPSSQERTPAPTPPATTGVTVVTPESEIVEGGEIEITASGFQPNEDRILVVVYSDPIVLDKNAKADANGVVRWIGKLPKGLTGKHTITLQGSINVGKEIVISAADAVKERTSVTSETSPAAQQAAGIAPAEGTPMWVWWSAAIALLLVAGASTALVVAQRRKTGAPTQL